LYIIAKYCYILTQQSTIIFNFRNLII